MCFGWIKPAKNSPFQSTFIHLRPKRGLDFVFFEECCIFVGQNKKTDMNSIVMREAIEKKAGRKMETAYDFEWLASQIELLTHEIVGINTLKRMWGYFTGEPANTRPSTLNVLAKYLGFQDYDTYLLSVDPEGKNHSSDFILSRHIDTKKLDAGLKVNVRWLPDRKLVVEHLGGGRFVVLESVNSKLAVDDTFECPLMIESEPLYLGNLIHHSPDGTTTGPISYKAGIDSGVILEVEEH